MIAATRESAGITASRSGFPRISALAPSVTSYSTILIWPSAKTSACTAALTPITREIAWAVSISDETTKSTSSCPWRQSSMYSTLEVRITVVALGASSRANVPATRFASSRDVQASTRSASRTPASARARLLAPFASSVATSKRWLIAARRAGSRSRTVTSCSPWRASTIVVPTWPAPMTKIFTAGAGYSLRTDA